MDVEPGILPCRVMFGRRRRGGHVLCDMEHSGIDVQRADRHRRQRESAVVAFSIFGFDETATLAAANSSSFVNPAAMAAGNNLLRDRVWARRHVIARDVMSSRAVKAQAQMSASISTGTKAANTQNAAVFAAAMEIPSASRQISRDYPLLGRLRSTRLSRKLHAVALPSTIAQ
jgi:hypothetical protein